MRTDGLIRLLSAVVCAVGVTGSQAATHVPVPTAVTGETLDGELVGSSPFTLPGSLDPLTGRIHVRAALSRGSAPQALLGFTPPGGAAVIGAVAGNQAAPGLWFSTFLSPHACGGRTTFWAGLGPSPAPAPFTASGVFRRSSGALQNIALSGEPAPGGGVYLALGSAPRIDAEERVLFLATSSLIPDGPILVQHLPQSGASLLLAPGDQVTSGLPILEILDADMPCGGEPLARILLETGGGPLEALVARRDEGWAVVLQAGDPLPDQSLVSSPRLPVARTAGGALGAVVERAGGAGPALVEISGTGQLSILAAAGDPAPLGSSLEDFGPPVGLDGQRVAWRASLADATGLPAGSAPHAVMAAQPGAPLEVLLAPGSPSPGGGVLRQLGDPAGAGTGSIYLAARATGEFHGAGLLRWDGGAAWLATAGESLPGLGELLGGGLRTAHPAVNGSGTAAFLASAPTGESGDMLYIAEPGAAPQRLLNPGDAVDGGGTLTAVLGPPAMSADGTVWLAGEVDEGSKRTGYLRVRSGETAAMPLAEGEGAPTGGTFRTLGRIPDTSESGALVFTATLLGGAATSGVFRLAGEVTSTIVAAGDPAPGGGSFAAFGFSPAATDSGAAFLAFLAGAPATSGLFLGDVGGPVPTVQTLALRGDAAPGGGSYDAFHDPMAGADGTVAFIAELDSGAALIVRHDAGGGQRLVGTGDTLPGGGMVTGILDAVLTGGGVVFASLEVDDATSGMRVVSLDGDAPATVVDAGALVPLGNGGTALLSSVPALAAAAPDHLVMAAELQGWSLGAAVLRAGTDLDGDGRGDLVDCAPDSAQAWLLPPATDSLRALGAPGGGTASLLTWDDLASLAGPDTSHDILSGSVADLPLAGVGGAAACAAAAVPGGGAVFTDGLPAPGQAFWYLVRGRNSCGVGALAGGAFGRNIPASVCPAP